MSIFSKLMCHLNMKTLLFHQKAIMSKDKNCENFNSIGDFFKVGLNVCIFLTEIISGYIDAQVPMVEWLLQFFLNQVYHEW